MMTRDMRRYFSCLAVLAVSAGLKVSTDFGRRDVVGLAAASGLLLPREVRAIESENLFDIDVPLRGKSEKLKKFQGKVHLVTNIKMDDPLAGSNFAALRYVASKYGPDGLRVWAFPTDQGYYEPDVAELIRAKAYQQFGFGQYPVAVVFDKIDMIGKTAHPLFQSLTKTPNPNGLYRISLNFEKFLLDANGQVIRRYPRKVTPFDFEQDISYALSHEEGEARLPKAEPAFEQAWRDAQREAQKGEYSFRSNYNVYDQADSNSDWAGLAELGFL